MTDAEIKNISTQQMNLDFWGWGKVEVEEDEADNVKLVYELENENEDIIFTMSVWVSNLEKEGKTND